MADQDIKRYSAEICRIAFKLWPNEFPRKYTSSMETFRDWLNEKTGLNENHIVYEQREAALSAWLDVLKTLEAQS